MVELVRVAALTGYFETMATLGADPLPMLREQGLAPDLLANPEQVIPARAAFRLLERSAAVTGCITLGLRMAEVRVLANIGVTSLLIAHQPTLRHALIALQEFRSRINSTLVLSIEEADGGAILREDLSLATPEPFRQSSNLALGVLTRLCASVLGTNWTPALATFTHQAPQGDDLAVFRRVFRCPLEFDQELTAIVLHPGDLDRPNARADDQLARHARRLLEAGNQPGERTAAQEVDQLIRLLLPTGRASIRTCAASLGLTVRTLQRQLDAGGTSFTAILNQARQQLAVQYLANPRMRVTDVAGMLGYASVAAFTRWHTQCFGQPPGQKRRN